MSAPKLTIRQAPHGEFVANEFFDVEWDRVLSV